MDTIFVNGEAKETLLATDRGVLYGDSIFETIAIVDSSPLMLIEHLARLEKGAIVLGIKLDLATIHTEIFDFIQQVKLSSPESQKTLDSKKYVLRVTITRGEQSRGYRPDNTADATRIVSIDAWPNYPTKYYARGINLAVSHVGYAHNELLAGIKHSNRLEQVLAAQSIPEDCDDVLMLDPHHCVISSSKGNLFIKLNDEWQTANLRLCGIEGVTRSAVLSYFEQHEIKHSIEKISLIQLELNTREIEAAFVCNSIMGIVPISSMLGVSLKSNEACNDLRQYLIKSNVISS